MTHTILAALVYGGIPVLAAVLGYLLIVRRWHQIDNAHYRRRILRLVHCAAPSLAEGIRSADYLRSRK